MDFDILWLRVENASPCSLSFPTHKSLSWVETSLVRACYFQFTLYFLKINFVLKLIETTIPQAAFSLEIKISRKMFSIALFFFYVFHESSNKCLLSITHALDTIPCTVYTEMSNTEPVSLRDCLLVNVFTGRKGGIGVNKMILFW